MFHDKKVSPQNQRERNEVSDWITEPPYQTRILSTLPAKRGRMVDQVKDNVLNSLQALPL